MVWLNLRIVLVVALPVALFAIFGASPILQLVYPDRAAGDAALAHNIASFIPLLCCFIPMALVHVYGTWLTAAHEVKYLSRLAFTCMAVNVGLNLYLIPAIGAEGAAWSCLLTQSVFAGGCIYKSVAMKAHQQAQIRLPNLLLWLALAVLAFFALSHVATGLISLFLMGAGFVLATLISGVFREELKLAVGKFFPGK